MSRLTCNPTLDATNEVWTPPQSGTNLSTPGIVGITMGGTALTLFLFFLIFLWCRQRRYRRGNDTIRYDPIEGPRRKPGRFLPAAKKVTSYRPGLNFDLVKNRTGDLVELSSPPSQTRTQSAWGSVSSLVSKVRTPSTTRLEDPQKQLGHHTTPSLSSIFTRPKEVRSQGIPPDFDISEGS